MIGRVKRRLVKNDIARDRERRIKRDGTRDEGRSQRTRTRGRAEGWRVEGRREKERRIAPLRACCIVSVSDREREGDGCRRVPRKNVGASERAIGYWKSVFL